MAFSDNLPAILEPWAFRASLADTWISEAFARDTDALTKALQKSLSTRTEAVPGVAPLPYTVRSSPSPFPSPASSLSERRLLAAASPGKISKRKSRATKRSATTFITADPSNFREMVQQVTGAQLGDGRAAVTPVVKPEPHRVRSGVPGCLPTLDTSAFLLDQKEELMAPTGSDENPVWFESPVNDFFGLDLDGFQFQGFPTLESWRVL